MIYLYDLNDRVISPFREDFIFTKLRIYAKFHENKTFMKISEFKVFIWIHQVDEKSADPDKLASEEVVISAFLSKIAHFKLP